MDPIVFEATEGEVYDAGPVRLRLLAQSPDQRIAITDNTVPPGFPGPVRHRHASMTDIFYVLEGELAFELDGEWRILGPDAFVLVPPGSPTRSRIEDRRRLGSSTSSSQPASSST